MLILQFLPSENKFKRDQQITDNIKMDINVWVRLFDFFNKVGLMQSCQAGKTLEGLTTQFTIM